jgi:crotonobetainyl-CoA:carnitine CoA-transferase CaiB-like acyl-CoA transferase
MDNVETLSHTKWECKYHVVFIPKYRRKALYAGLRRVIAGGAIGGNLAFYGADDFNIWRPNDSE